MRLWLDPWIREVPWRREWQLTLVFLPGEFRGQRSLVGYSPWDRKELDMTEATLHTQHNVTPSVSPKMSLISVHVINLYTQNILRYSQQGKIQPLVGYKIYLWNSRSRHSCQQGPQAVVVVSACTCGHPPCPAGCGAEDWRHLDAEHLLCSPWVNHTPEWYQQNMVLNCRNQQFGTGSFGKCHLV